MKFYRYEGLVFEGGPRIIEEVFHLVKETPCGYWIHHQPNYNTAIKNLVFAKFWEKPKWVSKTTRKRFAYPTQEEALKGFVARKVRQVEILEYKLIVSEELLKMARAKLDGKDYKGDWHLKLHLNKRSRLEKHKWLEQNL